MSEFIFGLILCYLMIFPWSELRHNIKRMSKFSLLTAMFFILCPFFLQKILFFFGEQTISTSEYITLTNFIPMANIVLFPLTLKGTFLLWKHEIRLYDYLKYVSIFLFTGLINIIQSVMPFLIKLLTAY